MIILGISGQTPFCQINKEYLSHPDHRHPPSTGLIHILKAKIKFKRVFIKLHQCSLVPQNVPDHIVQSHDPVTCGEGTRHLPVQALCHVHLQLRPHEHLLAGQVAAGHGEGGAGHQLLGQKVAAGREVILAPAGGALLGQVLEARSTHLRSSLRTEGLRN